MKSLEREGFVTAQDVAHKKGYAELALLLEPKICHPVAKDILEKLESRLHHLMKTVAGKMVVDSPFSDNY